MTPPAPRSLVHAFLEAVQTSPEKTLLHFEREALSYRTVHAHVGKVAGALRAWGLKRGDRVALYLENSPSFITSYLGALWLGGVVVPVNTRYRRGELRHMLQDAGARLVLTDAEGMKEVQGVLEDTGVEGALELSGNVHMDEGVWSALAPADPLTQPADLAPDDLAVIGYTSGTTGKSKGAMLTHGNFVSNSAAVTNAWGWTPDDHLLLVLPLFHMHGLGVGLHGTLLRGSTLTLHRKFEAKAVFGELLTGRVSMFFGVPTMYARLLEEAKGRREKPTGLRLLVSGSAPLSPQVLEDVERVFGLRILERYGMTETVMNLGNPLDGVRKAGSVGVPFGGVEVRVVDPVTLEEKPTGETGELQLRGPNVFRGYWRDPEGTESSFSPDGWFKTGDLGFRDADGYYTLNGRARELIISGGFNVYPREVEEVLEAHEGVAEAAVLGLPDPDLGEKVVAAVVPKGALEGADLRAFCKARLASFKKPRDIYLVASLPRNALGKVQKHLLREELSKGTPV